MIKINKNISWTVFNGETTIINLYVQKSIVLDTAGSEIWNELLTSLSLETAIDNLCKKYRDDNREVIIKDVRHIYELLVANNIIYAEDSGMKGDV